MKKIPDIINRLWNVCGQMEVGALLTCVSGIISNKFAQFGFVPIKTRLQSFGRSEHGFLPTKRTQIWTSVRMVPTAVMATQRVQTP